MNPLKVLCIGDIHVKVNNIKESKSLTDAVCAQARTLPIDLIVVMGDVLDRHESIHVVPRTLAVKFLIELATIKKTYVLIGNHDRPNNSDFLSDYHPFVGVSAENLVICDKVIQATITDRNFLFVPYVYPGRFMEALQTLKPEPVSQWISSIDCVFAHQEFYGTSMGVVVSTVGDKWPLGYPYVISGHIHDYCRPQKNIVYVGTPHQNAFGESEDKSISLFTFQPVFAPLEPTPPEEQRIDLKLMKRLVCKIPCASVISWIPPEGYIVKLVIEGTNSEIKAIMKLDYLKKLTKQGIKIVYNTIDEINVGVNQQMKPEEIRLPYAMRLKNSVQNDPGKLKWFNHLFGGSTSGSTFAPLAQK